MADNIRKGGHKKCGEKERMTRDDDTGEGFERERMKVNIKKERNMEEIV